MMLPLLVSVMLAAPADSVARSAPARADTAIGRPAARADTSAGRPALPPGTIVGRPAPRVATAPADTLARRAAESLDGLAGVGLRVESFAPEVAATVSRPSVRGRLQSLLRGAGVRVLTEKELAADRRKPVLGVSVVFARPMGPAQQFAYLARLDLVQMVQLEATPGSSAPQARVSAATWSAERLGGAYRTALRDSVLVDLDALAGAFARDWRTQNPK